MMTKTTTAGDCYCLAGENWLRGVSRSMRVTWQACSWDAHIQSDAFERLAEMNITIQQSHTLHTERINVCR